MARTRSPKLVRILAILAVAGLIYVARSKGWIDLPAGEGEAGGAATAVEAAGPAPLAEAPSRTQTPPRTSEPTRTAERSAGADEILRWFRAEQSGFMVETEAHVEKTLPDDDDGSRHQRFIVRLANDHTVLVSHNIDLAPRVPLAEGDTVELKGQYEWNERGGVLHWTHHDPRGRHEEGWIRYAGKTYE